MILKTYALFDKKGAAYSTPFYFHHDGQAIRAIMDLLTENNSLPSRHPSDFELWNLGTWDDSAGSHYTAPECLGTLTAFLPPRQPTLLEA